MPKEPIFTIETRQPGELWRMTWRGQGERVACDAARALARERRVIDVFGGRAIPVHPFVRVRQAKRIVVAFAGGEEA